MGNPDPDSQPGAVRSGNPMAMPPAPSSAGQTPLPPAGPLWAEPERRFPGPLAAARGLLRLEAYLAPIGLGLLAGSLVPGFRSAPFEDWHISGEPLLLWALLVGAGVALWVVVSVRVGRGAWAYWVALALQAVLILAAAGVTYAAVWGPEGALASAVRSAAAPPGWLSALLPLLLLFVVPVATLVLLLLPGSRRAALRRPPVSRGAAPRAGSA